MSPITRSKKRKNAEEIPPNLSKNQKLQSISLNTLMESPPRMHFKFFKLGRLCPTKERNVVEHENFSQIVRKRRRSSENGSDDDNIGSNGDDENHDIRNIESDMKNLTSAPIAMENKIKNFVIMEDLPDEILLKIMEYLSSFDILRKIAPVSKRFYRLTQDQNLIKEVEFKNNIKWFWSEERKKKYFNDFFEVLKNAQKLKFLSLKLGEMSAKKFHENWIQPSVNHQCLEEVCVQFGNVGFDSCMDFDWKGGVFNFLGQCPKLKILKIGGYLSETIYFHSILETISSFNSNCLEELHLNFPKLAPRGSSILFDDVLKKIIENLPNMKYLCLSLYFENFPTILCQKIDSEHKIKIEIRNTGDGTNMCCTFTKNKIRHSFSNHKT